MDPPECVRLERSQHNFGLFVHLVALDPQIEALFKFRSNYIQTKSLVAELPKLPRAVIFNSLLHNSSPLLLLTAFDTQAHLASHAGDQIVVAVAETGQFPALVAPAV